MSPLQGKSRYTAYGKQESDNRGQGLEPSTATNGLVPDGSFGEIGALLTYA